MALQDYPPETIAAAVEAARELAARNAPYYDTGLAAERIEPDITGVLPVEALAAAEKDYHVWLSHFLPNDFRGADSFAPHHEEFFEWGWDVQLGVKPQPSACLFIVNRKGNKSTSVGGLLTSLAARKRRKYGLVITRTQPQADNHVYNFSRMILGSNIPKNYPEMSPRIEKIVNRDQVTAWNRQKVSCGSFTLQGFGIEGSQRGIRIENYRPDFLWLTDIDDERDSDGFVRTLLSRLTSSIIAAQSSDAMIVFDQNLIHIDSVLSRIVDRRSDALSSRAQIGPIPAVYEPTYERKHEHWYITSGVPSWPQGLDLAACEGELNDVTMDTWEREYQQNVKLAYSDAIYTQWSEIYHIITWSEFARFFGEVAQGKDRRPTLPSKGYCGFALDWGNNLKHPCANRWVWTPGEGMPLTDSAFFYREMCWPRFPAVEQDDRRGPSAVKVGRAIIEAEKEFRESWEADRRRPTDQLELRTRVTFRLSSHERPEIGEAMREDLPAAGLPALHFEGIDTAEAREGILQVQDFLTLIEDEPHPFRRYPEGHPRAGERLMGRPRVYFIVADGQGELAWDAKRQQLTVAPAIDEKGMARTRFEYPRYRKPSTTEGADRRDAPKRDDDIIDTDRAIAGRLFVGLQPLTMEERVQLQLHALGYDKPPLDPAAERVFYMSRDLQAQRLLREQLENNQPVYGIGHKIDYKNDPYALIRHQLDKMQTELELLPDDIFGGGKL